MVRLKSHAVGIANLFDLIRRFQGSVIIESIAEVIFIVQQGREPDAGCVLRVFAHECDAASRGEEFEQIIGVGRFDQLEGIGPPTFAGDRRIQPEGL